MNLTINGELRQIDDGLTLAQFLESRELKAQMVVVERNGGIVPREQYAVTALQPGDALEIVQMMAGG